MNTSFLGSQFSSVNIFNFNFSPTSGSNGLSDILNDIAALFDRLANSFDNNPNIWNGNDGSGCTCNSPFEPSPIEPPSWDDGTHPSGSLKAEGDVITTPGGYKIEMLGQFEWKITGPDGKSTRVWGDPHVDEGDGGKWDFKKNSTFVLGDGTRINVTTAPWGNGDMTVTSKLEIISGNDRVEVTDIDKGKGNIGTVTQDGFAHANSFQGDVFVMGQETDDWSYTGKEIIGSNNGGDSFKLGGELHPRIDQPGQNTGGELDWLRPVTEMLNNWVTDSNRMLNTLFRSFNDTYGTNRFGSNPYAGNDRSLWEGDRYDRREHREGLAQAFRDLARMFNVLSRLLDLSDRVQTMRNRFVYA